MKSYLNCKKIDTAISRAKNKLIDSARNHGIYENFGQLEIREIEEKFIDCCDYSKEMNDNRIKLNIFRAWCMEFVNR